MVHSARSACGRSILAVAACSAMMTATLAGVGVRPAAAAVSSVSGSAFGYYTNVGLFGGPRALRGHGTAVPATDVSYSPSVTLPAGGSGTTITADDPDGAKGVYGPAVIFGGKWPDNVAAGPSSGPLSASTQGTSLGGSVTSSAHAVLHAVPQPVGCAAGYSPPCTAPGGIGPGPLIANEAHSTCTASESGVTASASFVNGVIETKYDATTQLPIVTEPIPANPPPNYTRSGTIDHVGDRFTIVLNEQIIGPDSITVNAAHMYLLGETARGDMVVGSSTCSLSSTLPNVAPVANDDGPFTTAEDTPLTVTAPGILSNDTDLDGNPLTATNAQSVFAPGTGEPTSSAGTTYTFPSDPPNGAVTINGNGSFTYTPDRDFFGTDTFTYVARDPRGASDPATVTITVTPVPDNPVAVDDFDQTVGNTPLSVAAPGVLANDTDGDGDVLTAGSASDPPNGSVTLASNGSYTYTPDLNFLGTDTFTYTVSDGTGRSDTGLVTIVVTVDGATLLKDINPGTAGSFPGSLRALGGAVYFSANNGAAGTELWRTDGTAAGTVLFKDIQVGAGSSSPANLTEMNGALYFSASNGPNAPSVGAELWKTDGTEAGTVLVKDINPGVASSSPTSFKVVGSTLFFSASDATAGTELWKSDGTAAGTVLVKDISTGTASSSPANFASVGTTLYFSASNDTTTGQNGIELWRSDGTAATTVLVKDINTGTASSSPILLQTVGTTLFFRATNGALNGVELWKSDGTVVGTVMVKDINVGTANSNPSGLTAFGTTLLFSANDGDTNFATELWKSDGTAAGTVMVANINSVGHSTPGQFKVFGNIVLFSANGGNGSNGFELWKTDGTAAGTVLVKDISPGAGSSNPNLLTVVGDVVYFPAATGAKGVELWKTDGTAAGTVMAEDINQGSAGSSPSSLTPAFGSMIFAATDAAKGIELWRLALPTAGTFFPLPPARILDTRSAAESGNPANPTGVCTPSPCAPVAAAAPFTLQVTGQGGIPATGVSAVVMSVAVTGPTNDGFLRVWPADAPEPNASNLNYTAGQTVPNLVTVKLSATGTVKISHNSSGSTQVIIDVAGYYGDGTGAAGSRFNSLPPARILDSRPAPDNTGVCTPSPCAAVAAGAPVTLQVTGQGGVPATGVTAVVMSVAVTGPTNPGFLRVWPADAAEPNASNLNYVAGQTVPNLVTVKLSPTGTVKISHNSSGSTHVIADVAGWYGAAGATTGSRFIPVTPARVLDTRPAPDKTGVCTPSPCAAVVAGAPLTLQVAGQGGVPSSGVSAVVASVAVTGPTSAGFLRVWPADAAEPNASNLNYVAGQTVPNLAAVKLSPTGTVKISHNSSGSTDVIVDVAGWFNDGGS